MDYAIGSHIRERIRQPTCVHPIGYSFSSSLTKLTSKSDGTIANVYRFKYIASNPISTWR